MSKSTKKTNQPMREKRHYRTASAYERMIKRVDIPKDKSKCWLWTGPVNNAGYGMIRGNDGVPKMMTVHRVAGKEKGLDLENHEVQHTCLTKNCVNPDHLVEGNAKSRHDRVVEKYGKHFQKAKDPHMTCLHCNRTDHVTWFSRKHKHCYPGMLNEYSKYLNKRV
jgi:hypothetical protein